MVKKILFTIAVVAFLAASVQAVDPGKYKQKFDGMWPYTYVEVPVCSIPVLMDVGYFVQFEKCGDYKIKLKQIPCDKEPYKKSTTKDFPCYEDCEKVKVRANFEAKLSGKTANRADFWPKDKEKVYYTADEGLVGDVIPGDGKWHTRYVCLKAWDIKIWEAGEGYQGQDEVKVADLYLTVKPNQNESWYTTPGDGTWLEGGP